LRRDLDEDVSHSACPRDNAANRPHAHQLLRFGHSAGTALEDNAPATPGALIKIIYF
jgi:hypothetical protein